MGAVKLKKLSLQIMNKKLFVNQDNFVLFNDDCLTRLKKIEPKSIDMIFADPPYFLSSGGVTCHSGRQVSVNKAEWDISISIEEKIKFNRKWIKLCRKVLKDDGTIWISGTYHNIYVIGMALELEGFSIINNITWQKPNPSPNLACRCFTHSTETILWARKQLTPKKKGHHTFNYFLMKDINGGKQMKDVWLIPLVSKEEKKYGKHPTQKPLALLERIILASTNEGDLILDPFSGSGTTGLACLKLQRKYVGIEKEKEYCLLTMQRYYDVIERDMK